MDSNAVYFGYGDEVQAVSLQDGSPLWSSPVSGIAGPPVIAEGRVYTAVWKRSDDLSNHWLHAFDAASGAEVWSLELEHRVTGNEPLADGGVLYVDTNSSVVAFGSEPVTAGATATEAANAGGAYTSEAFGYTITWVSPWRLSKPQSTASDTRDTVTLLTGDARLAMSATTDVASPAEMIRFYASTVGTSRPNAEVVQIDESAELSRATMRFTIDDTPYMEYVEIRPLPAGNGIFMTVLTGPAEWFGLAFQAGQQLVAIDQQPPFRVGPASSAG
jgi:hypothetical protein